MELIKQLRSYYKSKRLALIEPEFLEFEEDLISPDDLKLVLVACENQVLFRDNTYNSCILFVTGLTDEFDYKQARAITKGGSPPDIDIDFEAQGRGAAIDLVINRWGRDAVANIITHGTLKPRSLTHSYFRVTTPDEEALKEEHQEERKQVLSKIPPSLFGKEPTLEEIIDGNTDKGYPAHPNISQEHPEWFHFASNLSDMVANFGIHASGIVISDHPISNVVPTWSNKKSELITQFDMKEVEEMGLIKFDFLGINNLDIIKECVQLIKKRHNLDIDVYNVEDYDEKAYQLIGAGIVGGIFQLEASRSAKELVSRAQPKSIGELSDLSALNRPGPISGGLVEAYLTNKQNGYPPEDMPAILADLLKDTYWTLVYQEDVMKICRQIAGYSLREADDIRRAMGKL